MTPYLTAIPSGEYSLQIGAQFDPFAERSERGFLTISEEQIKEIIDTAHVYGNEDAKITWLEYSDVNCHYCKKIASDGTAKSVDESRP